MCVLVSGLCVSNHVHLALGSHVHPSRLLQSFTLPFFRQIGGKIGEVPVWKNTGAVQWLHPGRVGKPGYIYLGVVLGV